MTFEPSQNENRSDGLPCRSWSGMTSIPCPSTVPTASVPEASLERNTASGSALVIGGRLSCAGGGVVMVELLK